MIASKTNLEKKKEKNTNIDKLIYCCLSDKYVDNEENKCNPLICKNSEILKLENILKSSFKAKHNIYHEWINLYLWNKYCNIDKIPINYKFIQIYSEEYIQDKNIIIKLILSNKSEYYFIIKYLVFCWGESFSSKNNPLDNYSYIIQTPQQFDKTIEYFSKIGFKTINSLKPFRNLLEDTYSYEYL